MAEKLDVIIFGATGFTGKYTVFEATFVLNNLRWGIAGRNKEKLQAVLKDMGAKAGKDLSNTPILIADVNDQASLLEMAKRTRIVVNTCGPYRFFGEAVVRACIEAGTHHVDVSGETQYIESMQLKYNKQASERGVYIVSACGFESIPVEMGLVFAEKNFDGVVNSVETFLENGTTDVDQGGADIHYGTWESAVYGLGHFHELHDIRKKLYPQAIQTFYPVLRQRLPFFRSKEINSICLPFPNPDIDVVRRSQRFLYETEKKRPIQIQSYIGFGSWLAAAFVVFVAIIFGILSRFKLGRQLLLKNPKLFSFGFVSHEGPSEAKMEATYFNLIMKARGWPTSQWLSEVTDQYLEPPTKTLTVKVSGPNPGYGSTCVALLCAAKTILKENDKMPGNGGVLPPGAAFSKTGLVSELEKHEHGIKFEILASK